MPAVAITRCQQHGGGDADVNAPVVLHTAARRYCLDRHAYWCDRYAEVLRQGKDRQPDGSHYTPAALATFPRYNVLNAIRIELERIDPATLRDAEDTRALLLLAGTAAEDEFTTPALGEIEQRSMAEEREAFCRYVAGLKATDLDTVAALPYRRVLTAEEARSIWSALRDRWQVPAEYWYPLADCTLSDIAAFNAEAFAAAIPYQTLQGMLAARGIERVWELREYGPEYEQEVALFEPCYNGAEGYWSSEGLAWVVYASHENSVTVAGWLLQELKDWPSWQTGAWTGFPD
jgi:hypothetical protein